MKKRFSEPKMEKGLPAVHAQTVERLARHVRPVSPAAGTFAQWGIWWAMALATAAVMFACLPMRRDVGGEMKSPAFLFLVLLLVAGSALAAWGSLESGLPAEEKKGRWKAGLALAFWASAALVFLLFVPWRRTAGDLAPAGLYPCMEVVLLAGALCWLGLGLLISRNAPLHPRRSGLWAGLSSFLLGSAVVTLHCPSTDPVHILVAHFLPVLLYSLLTSWLGIYWFSRWKRKPLPAPGKSGEK